jgi:hypothetical protein
MVHRSQRNHLWSWFSTPQEDGLFSKIDPERRMKKSLIVHAALRSARIAFDLFSMPLAP